MMHTQIELGAPKSAPLSKIICKYAYLEGIGPVVMMCQRRIFDFPSKPPNGHQTNGYGGGSASTRREAHDLKISFINN